METGISGWGILRESTPWLCGDRGIVGHGLATFAPPLLPGLVLAGIVMGLKYVPPLSNRHQDDQKKCGPSGGEVGHGVLLQLQNMVSLLKLSSC